MTHHHALRVQLHRTVQRDHLIAVPAQEPEHGAESRMGCSQARPAYHRLPRVFQRLIQPAEALVAC